MTTTELQQKVLRRLAERNRAKGYDNTDDSNITRDSRIGTEGIFLQKNQPIPPVTADRLGNTEVAQSLCTK